MAGDPQNPDDPDKRRLKDNAAPELKRREVPRADHAMRGSVGYGYGPSLTPGQPMQAYRLMRDHQRSQAQARGSNSLDPNWARKVIKTYRTMRDRFNDHAKDIER